MCVYVNIFECDVYIGSILLSFQHEIANSFSIFLYNIFCESLYPSLFQIFYKHTLITPILKKSTFDHQCLNNDFSISNLSFILRTLRFQLERIVEKLLTTNLISHNIPHIL